MRLPCLLEVQQLHIEHERGGGGNHAWDTARYAMSTVVAKGDDQAETSHFCLQRFC
jgi:hypothetical protein